MMKHIPKPFIQDLLARTDIVSVIESRISLKKTGANFQARCPFHQEKTPSFTVSPSKQFYHCFGCGANGNAISFLMAYDRLSFVEAIEALAKYVGVDIPYEHSAQTTTHAGETSVPLYSLLGDIAAYYHAELLKTPQAIQYLKSRGLTYQTVKKFLIGYAPNAWSNVLNSFGVDPEKKKMLLTTGMIVQGERQNYYDRFRHRIMFPIKDRQGKVMGFGGRVIDPKDMPKYLNSPETPIFHKGRELYGWYEAMQIRRRMTSLLVVEGYMDVVGLSHSGIDYAVATLGTATSAEHIQKLFRLSREIVFCFDGDQAGLNAAWHAVEVLLPIFQDDWQPKFMFLPQGEDPDTWVQKIGKERFEEEIKNAKTWMEFFFDYLTKQMDLREIGNRAVLAKRVLQYIQKMPLIITRELLFQKLATMVNLSIEKLNQFLNEENTVIHADNGLYELHSPKKSPIRTAMLLLLQYPNLVDIIADEDLTDRPLKGLSLLKEMVSFIRGFKKQDDRYEITMAIILENWRDRKEIKYLSKLAEVETILSELAAQAELKGVLSKLKQEMIQQKIEQLMTKASIHLLTEEDKIELNQLLSRKALGGAKE